MNLTSVETNTVHPGSRYIMFSIMWGFGCYGGTHSNSWLIVWVIHCTLTCESACSICLVVSTLWSSSSSFSVRSFMGKFFTSFSEWKAWGHRRTHKDTDTWQLYSISIVTGKPGENDGRVYCYKVFPPHKIYFFFFRPETLIAFPLTCMESQHSFFRTSLW